MSFLVNYIKNQDSDTGVFLCEINFNFIGNHLIKNRYNNGPLNVENFARSSIFFGMAGRNTKHYHLYESNSGISQFSSMF